MKINIISLSALFLSFVALSQTQKEIEKMKTSVDETYQAEVTKQLEKRHIEREKRVNEYLSKTHEERTLIFDNGESSKYMIDVIDGKPIYYQVDNSNEAKGTLTDKMYGFSGLDTHGEGMLCGVWDQNRARGTHKEFTVSNFDSSSRMNYGDNANSGASTNHATHVSGTMVARGVNSNARGMAYKANIKSFNWNDDETEVQNEAANGMLITNHSYGIPLENAPDWMPGNYSSEAVAWDFISFSNPYLLSVISAGNDGNDNNPSSMISGNWDKLVGNKVSKNTLVVANANTPVRNSQDRLLSVNINSSSSQGPTDDFRIKPDIAGIGTNVYSCTGTSDTSYDTYTGTSMAAPNVAGSILLLQQYYNTKYGNFMKSATLKGIVCLTADDAGTTGPDPKFGWGLLNMKIASSVITLKGENKSMIEENRLTTGQTHTRTVTLNQAGTFLAGISWTDFPGSAKNGQLNSSSKALINDLDIRVTKDGETFLPWMLDQLDPKVATKGDNKVDNIEIVRIEDATPGVYTITVTAKGSVYSPPGPPGQDYSLIVYADNLTTTVSVEDHALSQVKIFPNPVEKTLFIQNTLDYPIEKIEIFDVIGKNVYSSEIINNNSVDVSPLNSGIYLVKLYSGSAHTTLKIVKK